MDWGSNPHISTLLNRKKFMLYGIHEENFYQNLATVDRWVDGDTVDLTVELFPTVFIKDRFRLYGINTPERGQPGFNEATLFASSVAPPGSTVMVRTYKVKRTYDRYVGEIFTISDHNHISVNIALVEAGHAVVDIK